MDGWIAAWLGAKLVLYIGFFALAHTLTKAGSYRQAAIAGGLRFLLGLGAPVIVLGLAAAVPEMDDVGRWVLTASIWLYRAGAWYVPMLLLKRGPKGERLSLWWILGGLLLNLGIDLVAFALDDGPHRGGPFHPTLGMWDFSLC